MGINEGDLSLMILNDMSLDELKQLVEELQTYIEMVELREEQVRLEEEE